jgi:hypothetical protein
VWGDFYLALKSELEPVLALRKQAHATVYTEETQNCSECFEPEDEKYRFRLTFDIYEDLMSVSWSAQVIGFDSFSVNPDLSWSYDTDESPQRVELRGEFQSWLDGQETVAGVAAVLGAAIVKTYLGRPPDKHSGLEFEVRGPWAH